MKDRAPAPQFHDVKPIPYKAVHVWLPNGTRTLGMWTDSRWWSTKGEVHPVEGELEVRKNKTKKLLKSLPESEMTK
jgi:hypothetical protein